MKACSAVVDKDNANFGAEFYKTSCIAFNFQLKSNKKNIGLYMYELKRQHNVSLVKNKRSDIVVTCCIQYTIQSGHQTL